jgi:outer membrane receptor protein involved in Fe transport
MQRDSGSRLALAISAILVSHAVLASPQDQAEASAAPESADQETSATSASPPGAIPATAPIEEIFVRGEHIPEPMVRTPEIASFITPADFARQGDDTAAVALRRVTGLSLVSNKFVYVRGLGERYSAALLNGSSLASPEPLQRVVPLDLFPSNILSSVLVQKTYSARYPGEFGGGLIDMRTIGVPEEPFLSFSVSGGFNSETTAERGLTHYGSDTDFTGFDDGTRDVPDALQAAIATGRRVDSASFTPAELQRIGRSFVNAPLNLVQATDGIDPDFSAEMSAGRDFRSDWGSFGLIAVASLDNSWQNRLGIQQEGIVENGIIAPRTDYDFQSTQNDAVVNGLIGAALEWGGHSIHWTNFYVHTTTKETRSRIGNDELAGAFVRDDFTEWFERELFNTQLSGSHGFGSLTVDWRGAFARTTREAPYERGIRYRLVDDEFLHNASQEQNYTRFSEVNDEVLSAGLDFAYAWPAAGRQDTVLSAGLVWLDNERDSQAREFRLLALDNALPIEIQRQRVDFLLSDVNIGPGLLSIRETTGADGAAAYDATLEVQAAYAQIDAEFVPSLRLSLGARYEKGEQTVTPRNLFAGPAAVAAPPLENDYVLPTATLTWNFYDDMQLRVGASKTIGRPQFRELAPQQYVDSDSDRVFVGNPFLVDTEIYNLDTRYEWYFDEGEFFTLGAFFKQLDNPIESIVNEAGATVQQTYINAPEALLYGAEIEIKKYFDLPISATWWTDKRLFVGSNYTWSHSEVKVDEDDVVFPLSGGGAARSAADLLRDGSPLQGQSEHLANFQLGIEDAQARTQMTLLATYVGERISARGRPGQPDLVQDPGTVVDLVLRQGFEAFGQDMTFGVEARNLLGEDFEEFQEQGGGVVYLNRYDLGRGYSISLTTNF